MDARKIKSNYELRSETSWLKAKKILDRYYIRKRIILFSLIFLISASAFVGGKFYMNHLAKNNLFLPENNTSLETKKQPDVSSSKIISSEKINSGSKEISKVDVNKKEENSFSRRGAWRAEKENSASFVPMKNRDERKNFSKDNSSPSAEKNKLALNKEKKNSSRKDAEHTKKIAASSASLRDKKNLLKQNQATSQLTEIISGNRFSQNNNQLELMKPVSILKIPNLQDDDYFSLTYLSKRDELELFNYETKSCWEGNNLKLLIYGSARYIFKNINSENFSEFASRRKNEEKNIMLPSLGAALKKEIQNFSISAGIEYSTRGERADYSPYIYQNTAVSNGNWEPYYRTVIDTDTAYIYGNQYFLQYVTQHLDSAFISRTDTVLKNAYDKNVLLANGTNKFYFIEVPVEISYCFTSKKIGVGASAGIAPALLVNKKGYYLKRDLTGVESVSEIKSFNKIIFSGRFSIDLYYNLNGNTTLLLRPQYRTDFNSLFKKDFGASQKYSSAGIVFGVEYVLK